MKRGLFSLMSAVISKPLCNMALNGEKVGVSSDLSFVELGVLDKFSPLCFVDPALGIRDNRSVEMRPDPLLGILRSCSPGCNEVLLGMRDTSLRIFVELEVDLESLKL